MTAKTIKNSLVKYSIRIKLPDDLARMILSWGDENIGEDLLCNNPDDLAFGREDEPHITLLYHLADNDPKPVESVMAGLKPFEVTLGKTSLFTTNDFFDVLKIDVSGEGLYRANRLLTAGMVPPRQYPQYVPHITLAYLTKGAGSGLSGVGVFDGHRFTAEHLCFSCRAGNKTNIKWG